MCFSIAKYLLFVFNVAFWLAGAACLGVGIWLNVDPTIQESISVVDGVDIFYAGAWVLIVAGAIMLVVGFFGCCGAIKESQCLLGLYFGCLFVIFGLQVGIGIWALVEYDSFEKLIDDAMDQIDYTTAEDDNVLVATQQNLKCCGGTNGCSDWNSNSLGSLGCGCEQDSDPTCIKAGTENTNATDCKRDDGLATDSDYIYTEEKQKIVLEWNMEQYDYRTNVDEGGKTSGGLINITYKESAKLKWLLTSHISSQYTEALRILSSKYFGTWSQQHRDLQEGSIRRNCSDLKKIMSFLRIHSPFKTETEEELINISTGLIADGRVDVVNALVMGDRIIENMSGKKLHEPCSDALYTFLSENMIIVGAVALAIGLAEVLGMIVAMCLCCSIKDK